MLNKQDKEEIKRRSTYDQKGREIKVDLQGKQKSESSKISVISEDKVNEEVKEQLANEMDKILDQQLKEVNKQTIIIPEQEIIEMQLDAPKEEEKEQTEMR